jgi:hypothetical protein
VENIQKYSLLEKSTFSPLAEEYKSKAIEQKAESIDNIQKQMALLSIGQFNKSKKEVICEALHQVTLQKEWKYSNKEDKAFLVADHVTITSIETYLKSHRIHFPPSQPVRNSDQYCLFVPFSELRSLQTIKEPMPITKHSIEFTS